MSNGRGVGFSPPSDAIAEFKVQTNAFDAQTGHTAGAVVNLAVKSGTNPLHAPASYFNRDDSRTAMPLLTERATGTKPTREYNRYTGTVERPDRQEQDVLHGVVRAPARRAARASDLHRADGEDAARRLLSEFTTPGLRSADGRRSAGARTAVAGNIDSGRPHQSGRRPPTRRTTRCRTGPGR